METYCKKCGAALIEGQRYCRSCGAPTMIFQEDAPTRILPGEQSSHATATTSPISQPGTNSVFPPLPTARQTNMLAPPRPVGLSRSPLVWIFSALLIALITYIMVNGLRSSSSDPSKVRVVRMDKTTPVDPHPPTPPVHGVDEDVEMGDLYEEEDNAVTTKDSMSLSRTLPVSNGASVSVKNIKGEIRIMGWDESEAELKVTKRGGSTDEREAVRVLYSHDPNNLILQTIAEESSPVEVSYEIKLPRRIKELSINSAMSFVKLSQINAEIAIDIKGHEIELYDVTGVVRTKVMKGNTKVVFDKAVRNGSQEYTSLKGSITVQFKHEVNADLKAETLDGDIDIDKDFGLKVEKRLVGKQVYGRIGQGGESLYIKALAGDIKITR